jgi:hypothetical protein
VDPWTLNCPEKGDSILALYHFLSYNNYVKVSHLPGSTLKITLGAT